MNVMSPRDKTASQTFPCKCKICISSIESDVYNKKKIQMFVANMTFISSREVKKNVYFIRAFGTHEIYIFSLHSMKSKSYSLQTFEYPLYIFTPLSSDKYKIWIYFFLIYINVFITRDENFYGIH